MPTRERVDAFVSAVQHRPHVDVIEEFYHHNASMQENLNPAREGKEALLTFESEASKNLKQMDSYPPKAVLVDGDRVTIHWVFELVDPAGQRRRLEEVALQKWQGDKIQEERFFYDSAKAWQPVQD